MILSVTIWTSKQNRLNHPSVVSVIKLFGGNLDFPKIKKLKKIVLMFEPALKCQDNAIFKQNYSLNFFITFKMAYSCCFSLVGNLDFSWFPPKKFHNIDYSSNLNKSCLKVGVRRLKAKVSLKSSVCLLNKENNFEIFGLTWSSNANSANWATLRNGKYMKTFKNVCNIN